MASTLRYKAEFQSIDGIDWIIYIDDADYFNNTQIADVGPDGFLLTYDGDDGNRMEPVVASSITFDLHMDDAAVEALIDDIVGAAEDRFKVKVLRDGSLFFVGQILTDLITDADEWKPFVTITATDGIGRLKDIDYNNAGSPYSGRETLLEHIFNCLDKTGLDYFYAATEDYLTTQVDWWDAAHVVAAASDPLSLTDLDHSVFVSQDKNANYTYTNCYDVLRQILTIVGARIYYTDGQYRIEQINAREAATTEERTYDKDRTNISNDAAAAYGVTIDQTLRIHNRMAGGNYSYLPALDRVRIRYEHHTPDDILPQINWTQAVSTEYTYGEVTADGSKTKLRISGILHFLSNYFDAGASANPYNKSIWRLKVFLDNGSGTVYYLSREGVIGSFYPSYGSTVWNSVPSWFEVHTIATEVLVREEDLQVNLTTPAIQSADTFTLKVKFEFLDAYALQPLVELQASQIAVDYNFSPTIEILEEGTIEDQDDVRIYEVTNGLSSANSANVEVTTRIADGPTANSPYRLKAYNGSAWVDSTAWKVGGIGTAYTIAELLARQTMAGQKVPVKKYNVPFDSADIRAHTKITDGGNNLIFLRGSFRAKYDEWNGTWYIISVDETSITTGPTIIISKPPPKVPIGVIDEPPGGVVGTEPSGNQLIVGTLPINPEMTEMQDTANADTFTALDVSTALDQISGLDTTPWGSTGEIVRLRLTTAGTLPEPLSPKTAYQFEIISATTVQIVGKDLTTTGSGTSTITPFFQNVTILSNDTFATKSNQIVLGNSGAEQVLFSGTGAAAFKLDAAASDGESWVWSAANSQYEPGAVTAGAIDWSAEGADHEIYYNNAGTLGHDPNFLWNDGAGRIEITGANGTVNIGEFGDRLVWATNTGEAFFVIGNSDDLIFNEGANEFLRFSGAGTKSITLTTHGATTDAQFVFESTGSGNDSWKLMRAGGDHRLAIQYSATQPFGAPSNYLEIDTAGSLTLGAYTGAKAGTFDTFLYATTAGLVGQTNAGGAADIIEVELDPANFAWSLVEDQIVFGHADGSPDQDSKLTYNGIALKTKALSATTVSYVLEAWSTSNVAISLGTANNAGAFRLYDTAGVVTTHFDGSGDSYFKTQSETRKLGIGTQTPGYKLDVQTTTVNSIGQFKNASTGAARVRIGNANRTWSAGTSTSGNSFVIEDATSAVTPFRIAPIPTVTDAFLLNANGTLTLSAYTGSKTGTFNRFLADTSVGGVIELTAAAAATQIQPSIAATAISWAGFANNNEILVHNSTSGRPVGNANFKWDPANSRISIVGTNGTLNIGENANKIVYASTGGVSFQFGTSANESIEFVEGSFPYVTFVSTSVGDGKYIVVRTDQGSKGAYYYAENTADLNHSWRVGRQHTGRFDFDYSATQPFGTATNVMSFTTGGNVGLGTTTASQKLHVLGSARVTGAYYDSTNSAGTSGHVLSSTGTGTAWVAPAGGIGGSGTTGKIPKFTAATTLGNSVITESSSRIGINQATPSVDFHVTRSTAGVAALFESSAAVSDAFIRIGNDNSSWDIGLSTGEEFQLISNTGGTTPFKIDRSCLSNAVVIDASANIGFGGASNGERVEVTSSGACYVLSKTSAVNGEAGFILENDADEWKIRINGTSADRFQIVNGSGVNVLYIDSAGAAGGHMSLNRLPVSTVDFAIQLGAATNTGLRIYDNGGGNMFTVNAADAAGASVDMFDSSHGQKVKIDTSGTSYFNGGQVGINQASPNAAALLELSSTTQGFLLPRMTATQASAIGTPPDGLVIYVTSTNGTFASVGFYGRESSSWVKL